MNIGEEIKKLREKAGLTQYALGKRVGTTQHCISQIEKGNKEPSRKLFAAIVDTLAVLNNYQDVVLLTMQYVFPCCKCSEQGITLPSGFNVQYSSDDAKDISVNVLIKITGGSN